MVEDLEQKLKRHEDALSLCIAEIEKLRAENERLRAEGGAHTALRSVYNDPQASETNKVRAAAAAIGYEQPKLGSILPSLGSVNRAERWRVFEMWSQRRQYIIEHRDIPPPNWDAHLQPDVYTPPEGDAMPPVDVIDTGSGFKVLTNLLPKAGERRVVGNGNSGNGDDSDH